MIKTNDLRPRAMRAAADRLRAQRPTAKFLEQPEGYLTDWADNLVEGVTAVDFEADLRRGDAAELADRGDKPARLQAPHSSAAMTVNTFGPFRHSPSRLALGGITGFTGVEFEYACDNDLEDSSPNFDLFARTDYSVIAVTCKFLEPLACPPATFSPLYAKAFEGGANSAAAVETPWVRMYRRLASDPLTYRYLDAAQLVKHYVGLLRSFPQLNRTLFYLYWEPDNAADLGPYRDFRREITDFALSVAGCETRFVAKSYRAQLQEWQHNRAHLDLTPHLAQLRQRYEFAV